MGAQSISRWHEVADKLGLIFEAGESPQPRLGSWVRAYSYFARHSYLRVFFSPFDDEASILVEIALGPPGGERDVLADAFRAFLGRISPSPWSAEVNTLPWRFETTLDVEEDGLERFTALLRELMALAERFDSIDSAAKWLSVLSGPGEGEEQRSSASGETVVRSGAFEQIGGRSPAPDEGRDEGEGILIATALGRFGHEVRVALGFPKIIPPTALEELLRELARHLHTKYEVQAWPAEELDGPELSLPSSARTTAQIVVVPGDYGGSMGAFVADLEGFLARLEKFSAHGVDLFEYLGIRQGRGTPATEPRAREEKRAASLPVAEPTERPVVLGLGEAQATTGSLRAGDFEDPRLQREDATTALVDLVLRHPGYSERRIGQVLSILLSIEYHQAVALSERAPCVIAWSVGEQRAQSFKEVIESAGGKALLVEPGTF